MTRSFLKMHGLGNDFVVIDSRERPFNPTPTQAAAIADRHTGVGCDQFIVVEKTTDPAADVFMRIRNADGGEVSACGNATRCVGRLILEETGRDRIVIQTRAGLLNVARAENGLFTADMGKAGLDWSEIPLAGAIDTLSVPVDGVELPPACCVGMGNPHAVFFIENAEGADVAGIGPRVEHHLLFPERTNVEFAQVLSRSRVRMRVWERGAGITRACGTGSCATAVAAIRRGLTDRIVTIVLDGGELIIEWREDGTVLMTGPAEIAFTGQVTDLS